MINCELQLEFLNFNWRRELIFQKACKTAFLECPENKTYSYGNYLLVLLLISSIKMLIEDNKLLMNLRLVVPRSNTSVTTYLTQGTTKHYCTTNSCLIPSWFTEGGGMYLWHYISYHNRWLIEGLFQKGWCIICL